MKKFRSNNGIRFIGESLLLIIVYVLSMAVISMIKGTTGHIVYVICWFVPIVPLTLLYAFWLLVKKMIEGIKYFLKRHMPIKTKIIVIMGVFTLFLSSCSHKEQDSGFAFLGEKKYLIVNDKAIEVSHLLTYRDAQEVLRAPIGQQVFLGYKEIVKWGFIKGRVTSKYYLYGTYDGKKIVSVVENYNETWIPWFWIIIMVLLLVLTWPRKSHENPFGVA